MLFLLFINDLPDSVRSTVKIYADDTKVYRVINDIEDCVILDEDLDKLTAWARTWQMSFHPEKSFVLRVGKDHLDYQYTMVNNDGIPCPLKVTTEERDLGVLLDSKLKFSSHITQTVKKANKMLAIIRRTFTYLDAATMSMLYKSLVRPRVEYAVCVWAPAQKGQINMIEDVQKAAVRLIPGFAKKSYEQRLRDLQLPTLVYRRARADMIQTYHLLHKNAQMSQIDQRLPRTEVTHTRGHSLKLKKTQCSTTRRANFFCQRVVNDWNSLPDSVVAADTVNMFKSRLDRHWIDRQYTL